jgi:hypothetical protein
MISLRLVVHSADALVEAPDDFRQVTLGLDVRALN